MTLKLTVDDKETLLKLARQTIQLAVADKELPNIKLDEFSNTLTHNGASFVTLTLDGNLRGCIGSLEAHQPLVLDVREHAVQAALEDYRFHPVTVNEASEIKIEISHLSSPVPLRYDQPEALPVALHPGEDGVIIKDGYRRATFLPQVWQQLPNPEEFLSHLCSKMGAPADTWRRKMLEVSIYHVDEFAEE
jgi:AmmeMemoRadiSam system protein A